MYSMAKWVEGMGCAPTWPPPYKPEEILQSLSGHNFNISKFINLRRIFIMGTRYLLTNTFEDNR